MILERPLPLYVWFFTLSLVVWGLQDQRHWPWVVGILLFSIGAYWVGGTIQLSPLMLRLSVILLFAFSTFVLHHDEPLVYASIYNTQIIKPLCSGLILVCMLQWYLPRSPRFDWLMLSITLLFIFSSISVEIANYRKIYMFITVIYLLSLILFHVYLILKIDSFPWLRYILQISSTVLLFVTIGFMLFKTAEYLETKVIAFMNERILATKNKTSGFSNMTQLTGNMQVELSDRMVILVESEQPFHHLRGNILTTYHKGRWWPTENSQKALPYQGEWPVQRLEKVPHLDFVSLYPVGTMGLKLEWVATFHYLEQLDGYVFMPDTTLLVGSSGSDILQNAYGTLQRKMAPDLPRYVLAGGTESYRPTNRQNPFEIADNRYIQPDIKAQLKPLAEHLTRGTKGNRKKAQQIEAWFHQHFQYSLQTLPVSPHVDPVVDFVLNRKPGFCSWFASGMVLMLRSVGIPAHLVSGWYGMDFSPFGQMWVIRERHAHDWVEVWDENTAQWLAFDPTPPLPLRQQMNQTAQSQEWGQFRDWVTLLWQALNRSVFKTSFEDKLYVVRDLAVYLLKHPFFYLGMLLLLCLNHLLKRRLQKVSVAKQQPESDPYQQGQAVLRPLIDSLLRYLAERQLPMAPTQTWSDIYQAVLSQPWPDDEKQQVCDCIDRILILRFGNWDAVVWEALQQDFRNVTVSTAET